MSVGLLLAVGAFVSTAGFIDRGAGGGSWAASLARQKIEILENTPGSRIVIVAGSNALFGISAGQLSDRLKRSVINLGLHGGLSWSFYRYYALPHLRAGDVVILPLEMNYFYVVKPINNLTVEIGHSLGFGFFRSLSLIDRIIYLRSLSIDFLVRQFHSRFIERRPWRPNGYWAYAIDAYGDIQVPGGAGPDVEALKSVEKLDPPPMLVGEGSQLICEDVAALKHRGVRVIATEPNILVASSQAPFYEALERNIAVVMKRCGAEFVSVPRQGQQPFDRMLDTQYHLNPSGRTARTAELIEALRGLGL